MTVELVPVYRCGDRGRRALTKRGAYMRAAWKAIIQARIHIEEHGGAGLEPGECDGAVPFGYDDAYTGAYVPCCRYHDDEHARKLAERLARWLRWRDSRLAAIATELIE